MSKYKILSVAAQELKDAYEADLCDGPDWYNKEELRIFEIKFPNLLEVIHGIIEFAEEK